MPLLSEVKLEMTDLRKAAGKALNPVLAELMFLAFEISRLRRQLVCHPLHLPLACGSLPARFLPPSRWPVEGTPHHTPGSYALVPGSGVPTQRPGKYLIFTIYRSMGKS